MPTSVTVSGSIHEITTGANPVRSIRAVLDDFGVISTGFFPIQGKTFYVDESDNVSMVLWASGESDVATSYTFTVGDTTFSRSIPGDAGATMTLAELYALDQVEADAPETVRSYVDGRIDGQVKLHAADGTVTAYQASADTDTARGTALLTAQTAAVSGDTIFVGPGDYELTSTNTLGRDGVNWWFAEGATVFNDSSSAFLWMDNGVAMSFSVDGQGIFETSGAGSQTVATFAASDFFIKCKAIRNTNTSPSAPAVHIGGGTVRIIASKSIESNGYDAIWSEAGTVEVHCPYIFGANNAIEQSGAAAVMRVYAQRISGNSYPAGVGGAVHLVGGTATIYSREIEALSGNNDIAINAEGASVVAYIRSDKIIGLVNISTDATVEISGEINSEGIASPTITTAAPITLSHVRLIADSGQTNSITATEAQNVTVIGALSANKPKHANITIVSPAFVYP